MPSCIPARRPSAAAFGEDQLLAPIEHRRFGSVSGSHLYGVGFHLMAARPAPDNRTSTAARIAEAHRGAALGFHTCEFNRGPEAVPRTPLLILVNSFRLSFISHL